MDFVSCEYVNYFLKNGMLKKVVCIAFPIWVSWKCIINDIFYVFVYVIYIYLFLCCKFEVIFLRWRCIFQFAEVPV